MGLGLRGAQTAEEGGVEVSAGGSEGLDVGGGDGGFRIEFRFGFGFGFLFEVVGVWEESGIASERSFIWLCFVLDLAHEQGISSSGLALCR